MRMNTSGTRQRAALTIAGSDSGGNAGIQADIRAFHVSGLHACTVITAVTAQNPSGVRAVAVMDPGFVGDQLDAVFEAYTLDAIKTGMLATTAVIEVVADRLARQDTARLVVDPVMVATSGEKLLEDEAVVALKERLLPLAALITPNLPEAEILLGRTIRSAGEMAEASMDLHARFGCSVLVKGGHRSEGVGGVPSGGSDSRTDASGGDVAEDVLCDGEGVVWFRLPVIVAPLSTHGTGCSLSAAIAAALAGGRDVRTAVSEGKAHVHEAIRTAVCVGPAAAVLGTPAG